MLNKLTKNLPIRKKLSSGFLIIFLIVCVVVIYAFYSIAVLNKVTRQQSVQIGNTEKAYQLNISVLSFNTALKEYLETPNDITLNEMFRLRQEAIDFSVLVRQSTNDIKILQALDNFDRINPDRIEKADQIIVAVSNNAPEDTLNRLVQERNRLDASINNEVRKIIDIGNNNLELAITQTLAKRQEIVQSVIVAVILMLVAMLIISRSISNSVVVPIKELGNAANKLVNGDYNVEIETDRKDEVGQLATAFDEMVKAIKRSHSKYDHEKLKLMHSEANYSAVFQSISDGLITLDNSGKVTITNKAFLKLLGLSSSSVVNKPFVQLVNAYNESGKPSSELKQLVHSTLVDGKDSKLSPNKTVLLKRADGDLFPVSVSMSSVKLGKEVVGAVGTFRDITIEKEIDKAKTEFVSLASHQLRTPLSTINWYTEMLLAGDAGKISAEQKKYLEEIFSGNKRMTDLVGALLNVSRVDLGTFSVDPEPTDLVELSSTIVRDLEPRIFKRKQEFKETYDKSMGKLNLDPKLMRMVIENLCSNAVKYTQVGGKIELNVGLKKDKIIIKVEDNGYGIPKKQHGKIFGKLFRADNIRAKDTEGTGLGLYMVKAIVEYSEGKIWFKSDEGKGTSFFVELPLKGMKAKKGTKQLG